MTKQVELRGRPKGTSKTGISQSTGSLIARARVRKGLGLKDVAVAIGVSVQFISNIERGRAPLPLKHLSTLVSILGINYDKIKESVFYQSSFFRKLQAAS